MHEITGYLLAIKNWNAICYMYKFLHLILKLLIILIIKEQLFSKYCFEFNFITLKIRLTHKFPIITFDRNIDCYNLCFVPSVQNYPLIFFDRSFLCYNKCNFHSNKYAVYKRKIIFDIIIFFISIKQI